MKLETLYELYPQAFKPPADKLEPFPMFGFECQDGWYNLLEPVIKYIAEYNLQHPEDTIIISQIKEKYGTLRFYTWGNTEELDKLITEAENKSEVTCETCGAPGILRGKSWYYTACEEHSRLS